MSLSECKIYFPAKTFSLLHPGGPSSSEKLAAKHKSIYVPSWCVCLGDSLCSWLAAVTFCVWWLAVSSGPAPRRPPSPFTPPELSRGPPLLISCSRSLLDLPINGQNSGMSLGAGPRRVMLGRRVTDGGEWAKTYQGGQGEGWIAEDGQRGHVQDPTPTLPHPNPPLAVRGRWRRNTIKVAFKWKNDKVLKTRDVAWRSSIQSLFFLPSPSSIFFSFKNESPHARRWFGRGYSLPPRSSSKCDSPCSLDPSKRKKKKRKKKWLAAKKINLQRNSSALRNRGVEAIEKHYTPGVLPHDFGDGLEEKPRINK